MRYEITAPDGRRFVVNAPEGATQDQILSYAQREMGGGSPIPESTGRGGGALPSLNRVIAEAAGAPVDLANLALKYMGMPVSERPFGGSASIEAGLARLGRATNTPMVPEEGAVPETPEEYIGRGVGEAASLLIPGYGVARLAASSARPVVAGVGRTIANAPVGTSTERFGRFAAPAATISGELASGAGAGAGRYIAETANPETPYAGQVGELIGGFTPGLAGLMLKYGPTGLTARAIGRAQEMRADPSRASGRLQSLTADPEAAARAAETPTISELTPAQRTEDVRLLSLEKAVAQADPAKAKELADRAAAAQETLLREARTLGGDPAETRTFFEARRERLDNALVAHVDQARARAQERVAALEPNASAEDASRVVRDEFDKAYDVSRRQEDELWRNIPQDVQVNTAPLFERFAKLVNDTPVTGQDDIPAYARQFLGQGEAKQLEETVSPATLQRMRSRLLEMERLAYREGRRTEGSTIGKIADDILETMNSIPDITGPYAVARDFTRKLNQTFREGPIKALTRTEDSSSFIPEELTLSRLLGAGGVGGGVAERSIMEATGESPAARAAIQDYLMRSLRDRAVTAEGRIRPEAASSWMRRNEALLEQYPDIRKNLEDALAAQTRAEGLQSVQTTISREMRTAAETPLGRFLGGDPTDAVARVFKAENPTEVAVSLRRSAARDSSGKALAGLRGAFVDDLFARARSVTPDGEVFSGSVIVDALKNPQQRGAFEAVLGADDLKRLEQIGKEFTALERTRGDLPSVGGVVGDMPSKILDSVARIAGAKFGAFIGGGSAGSSLQSASMMSSRFRDWSRSLTTDRAEKLLSRAVTDPELFATLMRENRTVRQQDETTRRLQGWLAGSAGRALFDEESGQSEQGVSSVQNIYNSVMNPEANLAATQNLINSPQMRSRVEAIFETPEYADLFTAALNREAQLFHRANQRGGMTTPGGWDQSLTNLVTNAIRDGNLNQPTANRVAELLMSNDPRKVAAAIRVLENASQPRR